jgi:membrane-associated phospholipid phosphatase
MNKTKIARWVSIAGHPFVMIVLLVLLLSWALEPAGALRITAFVVAMGLIPMGWLVWRGSSSRRNQTAAASQSSARPMLYLSLVTVLLLSAAYFHFVEHSAFLARGSGVTALMVVVAAAVNPWLRLSLHLTFAVYSGLILASIHLGEGLPILLMTPLLAWSRLVLLRHTLPEVIGGSVLGFGAATFLLCLWPPG